MKLHQNIVNVSLSGEDVLFSRCVKDVPFMLNLCFFEVLNTMTDDDHLEFQPLVHMASREKCPDWLSCENTAAWWSLAGLSGTISLWDPLQKPDIFLFESLTSMKARSAHQLLPVWTRPQQGVQRYHWSVVAAASRPAWQAEALVGFVSLSWAVGGGPHRGALPVRDAPLIQIPEEKTSWSSFSLWLR